MTKEEIIITTNDEFKQFLEAHDAYESIQIGMLELTGADWLKFCQCLKENRSLKEMCFFSTPLGDAGAKAIGSVIKVAYNKKIVYHKIIQ